MVEMYENQISGNRVALHVVEEDRDIFFIVATLNQDDCRYMEEKYPAQGMRQALARYDEIKEEFQHL